MSDLKIKFHSHFSVSLSRLCFRYVCLLLDARQSFGSFPPIVRRCSIHSASWQCLWVRLRLVCICRIVSFTLCLLRLAGSTRGHAPARLQLRPLISIPAPPTLFLSLLDHHSPSDRRTRCAFGKRTK